MYDGDFITMNMHKYITVHKYNIMVYLIYRYTKLVLPYIGNL